MQDIFGHFLHVNDEVAYIVDASTMGLATIKRINQDTVIIRPSNGQGGYLRVSGKTVIQRYCGLPLYAPASTDSFPDNWIPPTAP